MGVAGRSQFACLEDFDWRAVRDHLIAGPLRSRLDLLTRTEFF